MEVPQIQYIDKAVDIQVVRRRCWFLFCEGPVCVPETCDGNRDCRDFEGDRRMRLILPFGIPTPGVPRCERIQRMRVEECTISAKIITVLTRYRPIVLELI